MATWNSRGLRGSTLEEMVNRSNDQYRDMGLCLVQKIPTPITPIEIDKEHRHITLAYFEQKSTVDYIGAAQGIPICFDAKESKKDTFPIANVHEHQVHFMEDWEKQGGISFLLIFYSMRDSILYLPCRVIKKFWERAETGGPKSFKLNEIDTSYFLPRSQVLVPYLEGIKKDLEERD
ncbi:MAG: Holliday junction resolvase RecU [Eubacterium sp.]|nr:Holliday junction resolvase RecU [Eubacterium sp.]